MKIGFINFAPLVYNVTTPYKKPLGGTESAMCYLAGELAKRGNKVILYGRFKDSFNLNGVIHKPQDELANLKNEDLDFLVNQTCVDVLPELKKLAKEKTKIILWEQVTHNQPAAGGLLESKIRDSADAFVFVSQWQMNCFLEKFNINKSKCAVIKNAISPAFEDLFSKDEKILKHKKPILAYTSTPFRGLEPLLVMFPEIKRQVPEAILKVYSSMDVYQKSDEEKKQYQYLYYACMNTKGVEYIGSISQTKLSQELKSVLLLTYPAIWAETSCISVMEAMAAGCKVVTTALAALPETAEGFAFLIPANEKRAENRADFINYTVKILKEFISKNSTSLENDLQAQTAFFNKNYTWKKRAYEWEELLSSLS